MTSKERLDIIKQRVNTIRLNAKIGSRRIADEENAVLLDDIESNLNKLCELEEIKLLKALDVIGFTHLARDKGGNIFAYLPKPIKDRAGVWFFNDSVHPDEMEMIKLKRDLFSFVDWKDKEPTNILNLLSLLNEGEKK